MVEIIGTIVTTVIALASLRVAIAACRIEQRNLEISLYPIRHEMLRRFQKDEYDEILWDVKILFDETISKQVWCAGISDSEYQQKIMAINQYKKSLKAEKPEIYEEYKQQLEESPRKLWEKEKQAELFAACTDYRPQIETNEDGEPNLNYEQLVDEAIRSRAKAEVIKMKAVMAMQKKIEESVAVDKFSMKRFLRKQEQHDRKRM